MTTAQAGDELSPPAPNALAEPVVPVRARWIGTLVVANLRRLDGLLHPASRCCCPSRSQDIAPSAQGDAARPGDRSRRAGRGGRQPARRGAVRPHRRRASAAGTPGRSAAAASARSAWSCWVPAHRARRGAGLDRRADLLQRHARLAHRGRPGPGAGHPAGLVSGWIGLTAGTRRRARHGAGDRGGRRRARPGTSPWRSRCCCVPCRSRFLRRTTRCPAPTARACELGAFWISPRRYPDFAWAFGTRFLVQLGNAMGTLYLLYFLTDKVHYADPGHRAVDPHPYLHGRSDGDDRGRRPASPTAPAGASHSVIASGVVMAVAAGCSRSAPTWPVVMAAAAVLGGGFGIYLAVDAALITQVLPAATGRAEGPRHHQHRELGAAGARAGLAARSSHTSAATRCCTG